ncbi:MAG: hypothetical protein ACRD6X_00755 [Pyrinomonadaceae bacterium]
MADIVWTSPAFLVLEALPQEIAFGIIRLVDRFEDFPKMGSPLLQASRSHEKYRQLIFRRRFRAIYEFDESENCVYILNLQNCRQKFPTARQLRRNRLAEDDDLSLK